jgi:hypothetical protein
MNPLTLSATLLRLCGLYNLYHVLVDINYMLSMIHYPTWHYGHYYLGMVWLRIIVAMIALRCAVPISKALTKDLM